ncbi:MAG: hypothetical protein ABI113_14570 [Mucilaginibacter sp.]
MRFLAVILAVCVLFLSSSFLEISKPVQPTVKQMCCPRMSGKTMCAKKTKGQESGCSKQGCTMIFTCDLIGFTVVEPLSVKLNIPRFVEKPVSLYKIGDLSAYHASNWKPPKAC